MAKRNEKVLADLPEAGTVFAVPLADGLMGVCRVLRKADRGIPLALVAASDWISNTLPPLGHPAVRKILKLNHHNWTNTPQVVWVSGLPPKNFRVVGKIVARSGDAKLNSASYGPWNSFAAQILAQWRWDNEREAVLAEDQVKKTLDSAKRTDAIQKRAEYLSTISFSKLLAKDFFPTWKNYPPKAAKAGCRKIIEIFIRTLDAAEKPLDRKFVTKELKYCVEKLNQFDSKSKNFIETVEREDLCEVLENIVNAAKFPELIKEVENWRDW